MKENKIIDLLSYVVVIVAIVLFVVFKNNMKISLLVIGIGGSLFGIISLIKGESYGNYVTSVFIMLAITMILYLCHILDRDKAVTFMILGSFGCLMLLSALVTLLSRARCMKIYSRKVIGTIIDLEKNPNTNKEFYNAICSYEIDGGEYSVTNPYTYQKKVPSVGDNITIYVNPSNITDVWFDIDHFTLMKELAVEGICFIVSVIILITLFL